MFKASSWLWRKRRRAAKDELSAVLNNFSQNDVNMVRLRTAIKTATSIEGMKERHKNEMDTRGIPNRGTAQRGARSW